MTASFVFFFLFALIVIWLIVLNIKDNKLLKTVTNQSRGTYSERKMVLKLLKADFSPKTIFHDLYLINSSNSFSQIDIVLATKVGIIVFEIKEYSGWIFGNAVENNWTKVLAYGKVKIPFYNPILQNKKHIEHLRKKIDPIDKIPFYSVVVFFGDCELKKITQIPDNTFLCKSSSVLKIISEITNTNEPINYRNKRAVAQILDTSVKNGEIEMIRFKHTQNINEFLSKKHQ